jgi:hypothetical protein
MKVVNRYRQVDYPDAGWIEGKLATGQRKTAGLTIQGNLLHKLTYRPLSAELS